MQNVSGTGMKIIVMGSVIFPAGIMVTHFADDADPFDVPSIQLADKAMGLNGDLVVWAKPNPIDVTISVIPGSESDINLAVLAEANRPARGKTPTGDVITLTRILPDGKTVVLTPGRLTNAPPALSVASAGRQKSSAYTFTFENKAGL